MHDVYCTFSMLAACWWYFENFTLDPEVCCYPLGLGGCPIVMYIFIYFPTAWALWKTTGCLHWVEGSFFHACYSSEFQFEERSWREKSKRHYDVFIKYCSKHSCYYDTVRYRCCYTALWYTTTYPKEIQTDILAYNTLMFSLCCNPSIYHFYCYHHTDHNLSFTVYRQYCIKNQLKFSPPNASFTSLLFAHSKLLKFGSSLKSFTIRHN